MEHGKFARIFTTGMQSLWQLKVPLPIVTLIIKTFNCANSVSFFQRALGLWYFSVWTWPSLPSSYWGNLLSRLWPRFEHVMELNITSIRDLNPHKLGHVDTRPHYVSEPYTVVQSPPCSVNCRWCGCSIHCRLCDHCHWTPCALLSAATCALCIC